RRESKYDGFCVVSIQAYKQPKAIAVRRSLVWIPAFLRNIRLGTVYCSVAGMTVNVGFVALKTSLEMRWSWFGFPPSFAI
ncbi:MAG: hypothetical protein LBQ52_01640, partial [Helicobacteraceae bacterium]|nr:hypothetical protein [Helicobacteraceae bacterium]